jgi:hypothetical protein
MRTTEDVTNQVVALLDRIRQMNGFNTDIGLKIFNNRTKPVGDDEPPCIVLLEGDERVEATNMRRDLNGTEIACLAKVVQPYVVIAWDKCDPDSPGISANKMQRDIGKALFAAGDKLGTMSDVEIKYTGKDTGSRADGVALVTTVFMFDAKFIKRIN